MTPMSEDTGVTTDTVPTQAAWLAQQQASVGTAGAELLKSDCVIGPAIDNRPIGRHSDLDGFILVVDGTVA